MKSWLLKILVFVLLYGCSSEQSQQIPKHIQTLDNLTIYPADAEPARDIQLAKDITYRDTSEVMFGPIIRSVEVDEQGQVYIFDFREKQVHVFESGGSYMQSLGRPGRGPGEFTYPWEIRAKDGKLHVIDSRQTKISIFDQQTLEHRKDINISLEKSEKKPTWMARTQKHGTHYRPNNIYPLSNDGYLVVFSDNGVAMADNLPQRKYELSLFDAGTGSYPRHDLLSFDWTGKVLVHERERGRQIMFDVPYKRSSQFDVANGRLVHGWTEDFLFKFYDTEGNYQRAFYYPFDREPLSEEKALAHHRLSGAEEAVRNDTLPETWPAFNSVLMDEQGRLWVSIFTEDPDTYKWLVLESSGKLLAEFSWPARRKLQEVQEGFAYTLERDPQTGLHKISRYQIHME